MEQSFDTSLDRKTGMTRTMVFSLWCAGCAMAIWLLGIVTALPLFVFLYALVEGREKIRVALLAAAGTYGLIGGLFEYVLGLYWPSGLFFE